MNIVNGNLTDKFMIQAIETDENYDVYNYFATSKLIFYSFSQINFLRLLENILKQIKCIH